MTVLKRIDESDADWVVTYACNPFRWLTEGQPLPDMVVRRRTDQVNNVLIAAGAVRGAHILLAEHRVVLLLLLLLQRDEHIVQLFDLKRHN